MLQVIQRQANTRTNAFHFTISFTAFVMGVWQRETMFSLFLLQLVCSLVFLCFIAAQRSSSLQNSQSFSDSDNDDDEDGDSEVIDPRFKRRASSSSKTPPVKRVRKSQDMRNSVANAIIENGASAANAIVQLGQMFQTSVSQNDFMKQALEILQSTDVSDNLTENEQALAMSVFLDEKRAKVFCLQQDSNLRVIFLRREISILNTSI
jgi:hypothetical protein